jgi:glycine dehydrogenase subunit 1
MRYLPLSDSNRRDMLAAIGGSSVDDLFRDLPKAALAKARIDLPKSASEIEELQLRAGAVVPRLR